MEEAWEPAALDMPVWMRYKGWVFTVPIGDPTERPHVHIQKGRQELKVWFDDVAVARNRGVNAKDTRDLLRETGKEQAMLMGKWNDQFG